MGIGGLDKEFNAVFRRAFASRVFPPELVEQLGTILETGQYAIELLILNIFFNEQDASTSRVFFCMVHLVLVKH